MAELKTAYGGQTPKTNDEVNDVDELIQNANRLIESVYRDINMATISATPAPNNTNRMRNQTSAPTQRQLEIQRIHRFCETIDEETRPLLRRRSGSTRASCSRSPNRTQTSDNERAVLDTTFLQDDSIERNASDNTIVEVPNPHSNVDEISHASENAGNAVNGRRNQTDNLNGRRSSMTEPSNSRILNTGFLQNEGGVNRVNRDDIASSTNITADDYIDLSNVPSVISIPNPQATSRANVAPTRVDEDDDVIIVSCDHLDVVDLCTPVREINRRSVSSANMYTNRRSLNRQNRNQLNPSSRLNYRSRSPLESISEILGRRSVQTSTTNIQQPQQQPQQLQAKSVPSSEPAGVGVLTATFSQNSLNSSSSSSDRSLLMCPVCMESSVKRKPTSTKCGHVFCESCIQQALRLTHKCPMCNTKLSNRMLFRIYL